MTAPSYSFSPAGDSSRSVLPAPVGPAKAPDFTLPSHQGGTVRLHDRLAAAPTCTLLVFFRGHWCPYCRRYLTKIQQNLPRFLDLGVGLLAVSPESPETSRRLADELGLGFTLLSDETGTVINDYKVRNGFSSARTNLPHPAVFVISPDGEIRYKSIDRNYKKRTTIRSLLQEIQLVRGETPDVTPSTS